MTNDVLFPEPLKERTTYLGRAEPAVNWYSECTLPEATAGRFALNTWYDDFPDPDGVLRDRLRSDNDVHQQSMDELYLHHLLARTNEDVRYEEGGVGPDFRIYEQGSLTGAVEVASLFMRQDWQDEGRAYDTLADRVNRLLPPRAGWFVHLDMVRSDREPSALRLAAFVERHLQGLPPPGPEASALVGDDPGFDRLPTATYKTDDVEILIHFLPMKPGAKSMSDPDRSIVAAGPIIGGMVNSGCPTGCTGGAEGRRSLRDRRGPLRGCCGSPRPLLLRGPDHRWAVRRRGHRCLYWRADPTSRWLDRRWVTPHSRLCGGDAGERSPVGVEACHAHPVGPWPR